MKITIGSMEITDLTIEQAYALVDRYLDGSEAPKVKKHNEIKDEPDGTANQGNGHSGSHADRVVLEKLVQAGASGVSTQQLGEILGRRGKAIRGGLQNWAKRIGLLQDEGIDPFDECRADGTRRGVRLKTSLLPVAEKILTNK